MTDSLNVVPPKRSDMQTTDGNAFTKRFQEFIEEVVLRLNTIITTAGGDPLDTDVIEELILEFAGLHSDPLSMIAIGQIKNLRDEVDSMDQQIAALQASIGQLRAQSVEHDNTLEMIQDSDETVPTQSRLGNIEKSIREVFELVGASSSGAWGGY